MRQNLWWIDGGVYFGYQCEPAPDRNKPLAGTWRPKAEVHAYTRDRHLVTIGPNGSGKTRRLLIPNLHRLRNWSIVVIDPKGELVARTAAFRADYPDRDAEAKNVIVIDPFETVEKTYPRLVEKYPFLQSYGYNPVAALDPSTDDFEDDAKRLAEALIKPDDKGEKYWALSAQALLKGLLMVARLTGANLPDIRDWIGAKPDDLAASIDGLVDEKGKKQPGWVEGFREKCPAIAATLNRFSKISPDNRELFSILSTALTQTDWLDSRPVRRSLGVGGGFDFASLKQRPTTVYLVLPPRYFTTHATWLRLMVTSILLPLLRSIEDARVPVLFMLDEFAQLGHMEVIENNLALMRGYGVKLWTVFQDLSQAEDLYEKRWQSFLGNAGVVQSFAPQDWTTREHLSKLAGQRLYWLNTSSGSRSRSSGTSDSESVGLQESWQNIQAPIYAGQDLATMQEGQAVLFSDGKAPRSWLPDPSHIPDVQEMLARAEREIAGG